MGREDGNPALKWKKNIQNRGRLAGGVTAGMAHSRLGLAWQVKVCNLLLVQDLGLVWAVGDTQTCLMGKMFTRQRDQEEPQSS